MRLIRLLQKLRCNCGRTFYESVFWHGYMETSRITNNRIEGGVCVLFFEQEFRKLSLREVSLRLGDYKWEGNLCYRE